MGHLKFTVRSEATFGHLVTTKVHEFLLGCNSTYQYTADLGRYLHFLHFFQ